MRLFLALEIPDEWRREARCAAPALAAAHDDALRTVGESLMHLTLRFLGEVDEEVLGPLEDALVEEVTPVDVSLELGAGGTFGAPPRTSVVWIGVGGDLEGLHDLAQRIERAVGSVGLPSEEREFHPHLTVARVRRQARRAQRRAIARSVEALPAPAPHPFRARELALVRSQLGRSGPRYEVLARF